MKYQLLLLPVLATALPQRSFEPRSDEATTSKNTTAWKFNPDYQPTAIVTKSGVSGIPYSSGNWQHRKVGDWLIEYAAKNNVQHSDNFFLSLYETDAFDNDNQQVCGITFAGSNCAQGADLNLDSRWTNDKYNAQMVKEAIRNFWTYYGTLWQSIGEAAQEASSLVGEMVTSLEQPLAPKPQKFQMIMDAIGAFLQFAAVFVPTEAIVENIAGRVVQERLIAANGGSLLFGVSKEAMDELVKATSKRITKIAGMVKDGSTTSDAFLYKLAAMRDQTIVSNPDAHLMDVFNYQTDAENYAKEARSFLEDTWNGMLNNGFADGGIISQIFPGTILDINDPKTPDALPDDRGSGDHTKAVQQYKTYLVQRTMTQVLMDHGVKIIKRGSYGSVGDCLEAYHEKRVDWIDDMAHSCFQDTDQPGRFSGYFPIVSKNKGFKYEIYTGVRALLGSTWGDYSFDGPDFYYGATKCTAANSLWGNPDEKSSTEWSPQYTPPRLPDPNSILSDASKLDCAFSAPVCNFEDVAFNTACTTWKAEIRSRLKDSASQEGWGLSDDDDDSGGCQEPELFRFCSLALEQGSSATFDDIVGVYKYHAKEMGYFGGLDGSINFATENEAVPQPM